MVLSPSARLSLIRVPHLNETAARRPRSGLRKGKDPSLVNSSIILHFKVFDTGECKTSLNQELNSSMSLSADEIESSYVFARQIRRQGVEVLLTS